MPESDLSPLTVKKLRLLAKQLCLRGYTTARKSALITMIQNAQAKTEDPHGDPTSPTPSPPSPMSADAVPVPVNEVVCAAERRRPLLAQIHERYKPFIGTTHLIPRTKNKGNVGHALEDLLGIPHSSACLDCEDGELKAFPLKRLKGGLAPKESVAVTMCGIQKLKTEAFSETRCFKKLARTLFVPYYREGDLVTFYAPVLFTVEHYLFTALCADYETLQRSANEDRITGTIGVYLQTRTKGAGHGSKSRAFYLRPRFLTELFGGAYSLSGF